MLKLLYGGRGHVPDDKGRFIAVSQTLSAGAAALEAVRANLVALEPPLATRVTGGRLARVKHGAL